MADVAKHDFIEAGDKISEVFGPGIKEDSKALILKALAESSLSKLSSEKIKSIIDIGSMDMPEQEKVKKIKEELEENNVIVDVGMIEPNIPTAKNIKIMSALEDDLSTNYSLLDDYMKSLLYIDSGAGIRGEHEIIDSILSSITIENEKNWIPINYPKYLEFSHLEAQIMVSVGENRIDLISTSDIPTSLNTFMMYINNPKSDWRNNPMPGLQTIANTVLDYIDSNGLSKDDISLEIVSLNHPYSLRGRALNLKIRARYKLSLVGYEYNNK